MPVGQSANRSVVGWGFGRCEAEGVKLKAGLSLQRRRRSVVLDSAVSWGFAVRRGGLRLGTDEAQLVAGVWRIRTGVKSRVVCMY